MSDTLITPNSGALASTGNSAFLLFFIVPAPNAIVLSGLSSLLNLGTFAAVGALSFSGNPPAITFNTGRLPQAGTLTFTGLYPSGAATFSASPPTGALSLIAGSPSLNQYIFPGTSLLLFGGAVPLMNIRAALTPVAGILDTYAFSPELTECLEEAFERAGMNPQTLGEDHIESAFRSIKFMLNSEWSTIGIRQWMIQQSVQSVSVGLSQFDAPVGCIDMLRAVLLRNSRSTPINRISRDDYLFIADKTLKGRPDHYFVDRQYNKCTAYIWRLGENTTDQIIYNWFRQITDVGDMGNTLQMPVQMMEAFICGLAARLAQKFNKALFADLQIIYRGPSTEKIGGMLQQAMMENRERADCYITYSDRR